MRRSSGASPPSSALGGLVLPLMLLLVLLVALVGFFSLSQMVVSNNGEQGGGRSRKSSGRRSVSQLLDPPAAKYWRTEPEGVCCESPESCKFCDHGKWSNVAAHTRAVSEGCQVVTWSIVPDGGTVLPLTAIMNSERIRAHEQQGGEGSALTVCLVALASERVAKWLNDLPHNGWSVVPVDTKGVDLHPAKFFPHLLFPRAEFAVFVHPSRRFEADPRVAVWKDLIGRGATFNACWHPRALRRPAMDRDAEWIFVDMDQALASSSGDEHLAGMGLLGQMRKYMHSNVPLWLFPQDSYYAVKLGGKFTQRLLSSWFWEASSTQGLDEASLAYTLGSVPASMNPGHAYLSLPGSRDWCESS
jgi:hypothetical protein